MEVQVSKIDARRGHLYLFADMPSAPDRSIRRGTVHHVHKKRREVTTFKQKKSIATIMEQCTTTTTTTSMEDQPEADKDDEVMQRIQQQQNELELQYAIEEEEAQQQQQVIQQQHRVTAEHDGEHRKERGYVRYYILFGFVVAISMVVFGPLGIDYIIDKVQSNNMKVTIGPSGSSKNVGPNPYFYIRGNTITIDTVEDEGRYFVVPAGTFPIPLEQFTPDEHNQIVTTLRVRNNRTNIDKSIMVSLVIDDPTSDTSGSNNGEKFIIRGHYNPEAYSKVNDFQLGDTLTLLDYDEFLPPNGACQDFF